MLGCLAFGAMVILITITMCASFVVFFNAVMAGSVVGYISSAALMILSIVLIVILRKKFVKNSDTKEMEFLRNHPKVGLLRITHKVNGKSSLEYDIVEGPIKSTDELYYASDSNVNYLTQYFVAGTYTINVKYVREELTPDFVTHRSESTRQMITFTIESEKYHELFYDRNNGVFVFGQTNPPKSLKHAYELMSKAIKKDIKLD